MSYHMINLNDLACSNIAFLLALNINFNLCLLPDKVNKQNIFSNSTTKHVPQHICPVLPDFHTSLPFPTQRQLFKLTQIN